MEEALQMAASVGHAGGHGEAIKAVALAAVDREVVGNGEALKLDEVLRVVLMAMVVQGEEEGDGEEAS
jgi:hypothetical protein